MNKELRDYLHLYLGCECEIQQSFKGTCFYGIRDRIIITPQLLIDLGMNTACVYTPEYCKPILRKISDITEEEAREYGKLWGINNDNMEVKISHNIDDTLMIKFSNSKHVATLFPLSYWGQKPETFRFLLSKHFDLFQLIEEGLAIDKMTISQKEI